MKYTIQTISPHSESQRKIIEAFHTPGQKEVWVSCGTKYGKAEILTNEIPTPDGWKKFGDLKAGDRVFDENGDPILIKYVTPIMFDHKCYEVIFSDGHVVKCDAEHLWVTETHYERKNKARKPELERKVQIRTTEEIKETLIVKFGGKERPNHSISLVSKPLSYPTKDFLIHPYVLGVWLGDGSIYGGMLSLNKEQSKDILYQINNRGEKTHKVPSAEIGYRCEGLTTKLKDANLIKNKHVPEIYLQGSPEQRLELLRGVMDTDGTVCKRGHCTFDNTNKNIADAVESLCISLGIKVSRGQRFGKLNGVEKKLCYRVFFSTDIQVFHVKQKADRIREVSLKAKTRYITEVREIESEPVRCIKVDSKSQLYLTSKGCIPTHNTIAGVNAFVSAVPVKSNAVFRWVAPIYAQSMIAFRYARRFLPKSKHIIFNKSDPSILFDPISTRWEFRTGKDPESLEGEATAGNILDECSKLSEDVYTSVRTTTTVTGGPILGISTPRGKNWFFHKCMAAREEEKWALKNGKIPKRIFITAATIDNPYVSPEAIMDAQKSLPRRLFRQYYLAEFVDDHSTFANFKSSYYTDRLEFDYSRELWIDPKIPKDEKGKYKCNVIIGADWAKVQDYCVFTAWDYKEKKMIGFWRFNGVNYVQAVKKLYDFANSFTQIELIMHDSTGIGGVIDDLLDKIGFAYQGVTFTQKNKTFMVNNMIIAFEQNEIKLPHWPEMEIELDAYEVQTNEIGLMKFSAPNGMHDDIVCSMFLGWAAVSDYATGELSVKIIEELKKNTNIEVDWMKDYPVNEGEVIPWEQAILKK